MAAPEATVEPVWTPEPMAVDSAEPRAPRAGVSRAPKQGSRGGGPEVAFIGVETDHLVRSRGKITTDARRQPSDNSQPDAVETAKVGTDAVEPDHRETVVSPRPEPSSIRMKGEGPFRLPAI
jgi:hypothetical protein